MGELGLQLHAMPMGIEDMLCHLNWAGCTTVYDRLAKVAQIVFADIILSGDNALVIGMAASTLSATHRRLALIFGLGMAALLRIVFALVAVHLLKIPGILLVGGLLLAWVCWRFYKDLREFNQRATTEPQLEQPEISTLLSPRRRLLKALVTITLADVSMSLDNVIAVAAIARHDTQMLVFGLALAILLMAFFATIIMKVMTRYPALSWAGLVFLIYLTLKLLYDGTVALL